MRLFDGKVKVGTRISLEGDDFAPSMGALVGSSYTEDVMNHGTLNQLVQGNVTRLFCVNEDITVTANRNLKVGVNRSATIGVNDSLTVGANRTEMVGGVVNQTFGGGQITTCAGPHMRTDVSSSVWMCPSGTFINSGDLYEFKAFSGGVYGMKQENTIGMEVNLKNLVMEFTKSEFSFGLIGMSYCGTEVDLKEVMAEKRNFEAELNMVKAELDGANTEVRSAEAEVGASVVAPPTSVGGN
ncbi:MAG: hypothetical protein KatS3mg005_0476 [Bryobacteraceae bacterium]|nr:MAG: hypothetical protein KatS3mg005_0476 [Bryobacteraceae bacterium]